MRPVETEGDREQLAMVTAREVWNWRVEKKPGLLGLSPIVKLEYGLRPDSVKTAVLLPQFLTKVWSGEGLFRTLTVMDKGWDTLIVSSKVAGWRVSFQHHHVKFIARDVPLTLFQDGHDLIEVAHQAAVTGVRLLLEIQKAEAS